MPQSTDSPRSSDERAERIQQLIDDYIDRREAGETVLDAELMAENPELMPELEEAIHDLHRILQAKHVAQESRPSALQVRCPHCHERIEVVDDRSLSDLVCPCCGSQFNLTNDSDQESMAGEQKIVNHFQLLERVGVGAFGVVWKARDTQLDRIVALKIPRRGHLSAEEAEQFVREARAAAQLRHPHIVSVLEVGRHQDRIYLACDFIDGMDLADWLVDGQPTPREAAELCATLADAIGHAHWQDVIHRDLKPSNIMLDANGEPHLMDFGLAKRESGEVTMTVDGKLLGTPAYMSPEQARGDAHSADRRSDIYSLGVILFELLTGERPFRGNTRMLLQQILVTDPPNPRQLNDRVPRDLANICLRCLEKDPSKRYPTAVELRNDLRRFLKGQPVHARPISNLAQVWRWGFRNPSHALLLAVTPFVVFGIPLAVIRWSEVYADRLLATTVYDSRGENAFPSSMADFRVFAVVAFFLSLVIAAMFASATTWICFRRRRRLRISLILGYALITSLTILLIGSRFNQSRTVQRAVDIAYASGGGARFGPPPNKFPGQRHTRDWLTWYFYRLAINREEDWEQGYRLSPDPVFGTCVFRRPYWIDLGPRASVVDLHEVLSSEVHVLDFEIEHLSSGIVDVLGAHDQVIRDQGRLRLTLSGDEITDDVMRLVSRLNLDYVHLELNRTLVTAKGIILLAETKPSGEIVVKDSPAVEPEIRALDDHHRFRVVNNDGQNECVLRIMDITQRANQAGARYLNLDSVYDSGLNGRDNIRWPDYVFFPSKATSLVELPTGIQTFAGISFDVRGVVDAHDKPSIPIKQNFVKQIHFLHGAMHAQGELVGNVIAKYILRYADGAIEERPIVYGKDVLDWYATPPDNELGVPAVAWSGSNEESRLQGRTIQLYSTTWENPRPGVEVVGIEIVGEVTDGIQKAGRAFCVAVTIE